MIDSLEWWRVRQYIDAELERLANVPNNDYYEGQYVALVKMKSFFLTPEERAGYEQVRREMFG